MFIDVKQFGIVLIHLYKIVHVKQFGIFLISVYSKLEMLLSIC